MSERMTFGQRVAQLHEYVKINGDARVMTGANYPDEDGLGRWCNRMRHRYHRGFLSDEQVKLLESAGFVFDVNQHLFEQGVKHLGEWVRQNPQGLPPRDWRCKHGEHVGQWVTNRRREDRQGVLEKKRRKVLQRMGMLR